MNCSKLFNKRTKRKKKKKKKKNDTGGRVFFMAKLIREIDMSLLKLFFDFVSGYLHLNFKITVIHN